MTSTATLWYFVALQAAASMQLVSQGRCLDAALDMDSSNQKQAVCMRSCNGSPQQDWHFTAERGLANAGERCLRYGEVPMLDGGADGVRTESCSSLGDSDSMQEWTLLGDKLQSGGLCFSWRESAQDDCYPGFLAECQDDPHQQIDWWENPQLPPTMVFPHGFAGSHCYRIPSVLRTDRGTLVAFAEARLHGCFDSGVHNLVCRRSMDGGRTWGELITVAEGFAYAERALSNPNPVEVHMANGSTAILMIFDTRNNPSKRQHGDTMQIWSHDDGLSWTSSSAIEGLQLEGVIGCMPGPSVGIQEAGGTLYFVCHTLYEAALVWSTDLGKTWQRSEPVNGVDECSIAATPGDRIAMNCKSKCGRSQLMWSSAGQLLENHCIVGLPDPRCQGSLVWWHGALWLSNAASRVGRRHLTVRRSIDDGMTWDSGVLVESGYSGYSQLVGLPKEEALGVLYERHGGLAFKRVRLIHRAEDPFAGAIDRSMLVWRA